MTLKEYNDNQIKCMKRWCKILRRFGFSEHFVTVMWIKFRSRSYNKNHPREDV